MIIDTNRTANVFVISQTRASTPTVWLEVSYSGLRPPHQLFEDLRAIGWQPPVVPPPPKTAIDWLTPDPSTGKAYTVLDYRIDGARIAPPEGVGPRGEWTADERPARFRSVDAVLRRHGIELPELERYAAAHAGHARRVNGSGRPGTNANRSRHTGVNGNGSVPSPNGTDPLIDLTVPDDGAIVLRGIVTPTHRGEVNEQLAELGVSVSSTPEVHSSMQNFRGSSVAIPVTRYRVTAFARASQAPAAAAVLRRVATDTDITVLTASEVADLEAKASNANGHANDAGTDDRDEAEDMEPETLTLARAAFPCLHLVIEPFRVDSVMQAIEQRGLRFWRRRPCELRVVGVFRGSRHESIRPGIEVEVWVPAAHAERVIESLALAGGLDTRESDRAWITRPEDSTRS